VVPASSTNIALTELNFNPPTPGEEFLELLNLSGFAVELTGCRFTQGIEYTFPQGTQLAPGARLVLVENRTAFSARYPAVTALAPGEYAPSNLSNGGETVTLLAADGLSNIFSVNYSDGIDSTDGGGSSLVRSLESTTPDLDQYAWRASTSVEGNPGGTDAIVFTGSAAADLDGDGFSALIEHAFRTSDLDASSRPAPPVFVQHPGAGTWHVEFTTAAAADDVAITPEVSSNLSDWTTPEMAHPALPAFERGGAPGASTTWTSGPAVHLPGHQWFLRVRVSLR
jgi:Lamin Tail Domain